MRVSAALGRKVVSLDTAETVGTLDEFVVDPAQRRIIALGVAGVKHGNVVRWNDIESFGPDAVTVRAADRIGNPDTDADRLGGKDHRFLDKRVLTDAGDELGPLEDVEFDADSGELQSLVLAGQQVSADRLLGVGSYAVVVRAG
jgi:sporulation protein YlmC with PRC-barrel domain